MPDDRELKQTGTRPGCSPTGSRGRGRRRAGHAVEVEALDADDILVKKPLGILFWLAVGWVGLVVILAIIANLLPLPNPDFQNYTALNASPEHPPPAGHRRPGSGPAEPAHLRGPGLPRRRVRLGGHRPGGGRNPGPHLGLQGRSAWTSSLNAGAFVLLAFPAIVAVIAIVAFWGRRCGRSPSSSAWRPSPSSTGWSGPRACPSPTATSSSRRRRWGPPRRGSSSGRSCPTSSRWPSPSA